MTRLVLTTLVAVLTGLPVPARSEAQDCPPVWSERFAPAGLNSPFRILDIQSASGQETLAIGTFTNATGEFRQTIARLIDRSWVGIERPTDGLVPSRVDVRLGSADEVGAVVGGWLRLANGKHVLGVASYDAGVWMPIGTPLSEEVNFPPSERNITSLHRGEVAGQQVLIVAGNFPFPGDPLKDGLAAWNGSQWLALRTQPRWPQVLKDPMVGTVRSSDGSTRLIVVFNDPGHEGGTFELVEGEWRYLRPSPVMFAPYGRLVVLPGSQGDEIRIIGARKREITLVTEPGQWKWTGAAWENLGLGNAQSIDEVRTQPDANGDPWVVARGSFTGDDGIARTGIATLRGDQWELFAEASGSQQLSANRWDVRGTPEEPVITACRLTSAPHISAFGYRGYRWQNGVWSLMDEYTPRGTVGGTIFDMLPVIEASGRTTLYIAGDFIQVDGQSANRVASWNGTQWSALGTGLNLTPLELVAFAPENQLSLIALIQFSGGQSSGVMRWDGQSWSELPGLRPAWLHSMCLHNTKDGPLVVVGGSAIRVTGLPFVYGEIAAWNGSEWALLTRPSTARTVNTVLSVISHNDGSGETIYCFHQEFDTQLTRLARLVDGEYQFLTNDNSAFGTMRPARLISADDGRGRRLYAIGGFSRSTGAIADGLAVWNGSQWLPVADRHGNEIAALGGIGDLTEIRINGKIALAGIGPELIVWSADGVIDRRPCFNVGYRAIAGLRRGGRDVLSIGGGIQIDPGTRTERFSEATFCPTPCPADVNSDGTTDAMDLASLLSSFGARNLDPMFLPDINTDGWVDGRDLAVLLATFGTPCD